MDAHDEFFRPGDLSIALEQVITVPHMVIHMGLPVALQRLARLQGRSSRGQRQAVSAITGDLGRWFEWLATRVQILDGATFMVGSRADRACDAELRHGAATAGEVLVRLRPELKGLDPLRVGPVWHEKIRSVPLSPAEAVCVLRLAGIFHRAPWSPPALEAAAAAVPPVIAETFQAALVLGWEPVRPALQVLHGVAGPSDTQTPVARLQELLASEPERSRDTTAPADRAEPTPAASPPAEVVGQARPAGPHPLARRIRLRGDPNLKVIRPAPALRRGTKATRPGRIP